MSDIFYTEVDPNLQLELNSRGVAGWRRTSKDLQFMLEKVANVQLTPYKDETRSTEITEAILGGKTVIGTEYLPSGPNGFLSDRTYTVQEQNIQNGNIVRKTKEERINSSKRIPPYITSLDITIADSSNGLLNSATININIPNPERDLNFIESVYLRPGRQVKIQIAHADSVIMSSELTSGLLTSSIASTEKIKTLYPSLTTSELNQYRKMNEFVFDGLIKSFTLDYQPDMSVIVTLSMAGISQTYADISLIMNTKVEKTDPVRKLNLYENQIDATFGVDNSNLVLNDAGNTLSLGEATSLLNTQFISSTVPPLPTADQLATPDQIILDKTELGTFYTNLDKEVTELIEFEEKGIPRSDFEKLGFTAAYNSISEIQQIGYWAAWGEPISNKVAYQRYIQLAWLIDFINRLIISKRRSADSYATIICTENENLCTSNYYENMVSSDPLRIWLAGSSNFPTDVYDKVSWYSTLTRDLENYVFSESYNITNNSTIQTVNVSYPTRIFINMEVIQQICASLENQKNFTVAALLSLISAEIYDATGGAIDMKLITHPELTEFLLYYDAKSIAIAKREKPVVPYSVPMFSNHEYGSIVRDFKFSGKLPQDASNLAYVVNQDPSEIAESDIAPYVAYMYSANTVERTGPHELVGNLITQDELDAIKTKYKEAHLNFKEKLRQAKVAFSLDITNPEKRAALAQALQKYIQYPTPSIIESNQLTAPVIPFDVEFTIDGIHGFRYGDVLTFDGLPTRYKQNAVFSIISITHTVANDGQWTTSIRCIMRPNIDV